MTICGTFPSMLMSVGSARVSLRGEISLALSEGNYRFVFIPSGAGLAGCFGAKHNGPSQ